MGSCKGRKLHVSAAKQSFSALANEMKQTEEQCKMELAVKYAVTQFSINIVGMQRSFSVGRANNGRF